MNLGLMMVFRKKSEEICEKYEEICGKYQEICGKYEGICGKYEENMMKYEKIGRSTPYYIDTGTCKNSEISRAI